MTVRSRLKLIALGLLGLVAAWLIATRFIAAPEPVPEIQGLIGPRVIGPSIGPQIGPRIGATSSATPLILLFGDSQIPGEAPTDAADPSFNVTATQSTAFVTFNKHYAQSAADPPTYETDLTGGVRPYAIGGTPGMGLEISIGQELTRLQQRSVLAVFGIAGLACAQSLPASTYPTAPPNIWSQVVSRVHSVEASTGSRAKVALISLGNNDGANGTDAGNLTTNSTTLAAALRSAFPGITISWIKINADTVNAAGFGSEALAITNQATFFTNDSAIVSIFNDDRPLQSDHAHFTADTYLTVGQRFVHLALPALGLSEPRPVTFPAVVGWGPQMFSSGASTSPPSWGRAGAGDLEILVVVSLTASGVNNALTTPTGWTLIDTTSSTTGGVTIRVGFYRRAVDSTMVSNNHGFTAPTTVAAANSNEFSEIITIRGPSAGSTPTVEASQLSVNNAFNTSLTDTGVTTLGSNRTVVLVTAGFRTNASANTVTVSAPNLSNCTAIKNGTRDSGLSNFATIDVQTCTLAAAGSTGNPAKTFAQNTIAVDGVFSIAP